LAGWRELYPAVQATQSPVRDVKDGSLAEQSPPARETLRKLADSDDSLAVCFERIAAAHHARPAVVSDSFQLSYAELNAGANRLAHVLVSHGGGVGDRIATLMHNDGPALVALIAVLKAGRIAVPLNPNDPAARLRQVIDDCEPFLVVTETALQSLATEIAGPSCRVVVFEENSAGGPDRDPPRVAPSGPVAMLGYTSGSTGRPKGVMVAHRQILRRVSIQSDALDFSAEDRIPLFSLLCTGQAQTIVWSALLHGMALCPFPVVAKGVSGLADWLINRRITVYASSASIFRNFMNTLDPDFEFSGIRAVRVSSEATTSQDFDLFRAHFPAHSWFVHTFMSTETSCMAWSRRLQSDKVPDGRLPLRPVSEGQALLILDEHDRPVPAGEVGEIVIRSRYEAAGYWRNAEQTAKHFSAALDDAGTRLFRTGDLGRLDAVGLLDVCGRKDERIKIRGHRIELPEITLALHRLDGIERAVVEAVPQSGREPLLVAFVTLRDDQSWVASELRRALRASLPDYAVPSDFVILDKFPLAPNGKIDREKLRRDFRPRRQEQSEGPATETEALLAAIWSEVFELPGVGRDDDFFALGGDSLTAAVIAARVHNALKVELDLAAFSDFPTLAELAAVIDRLRAAEATDKSPLRRARRRRRMPLSFAQERIWKFSQFPEVGPAYTMARVFRIVGPLDVEVLRDCMNDLVRRHEILRTTFAWRWKTPVASIHPSMATSLQYSDLSGALQPEAAAESIFNRESAFVFDLRRGPLLRFTLVRLRDDDYQLLQVFHHLIFDNPALALYFRELAMLYEAKVRGGPSPLPEAPSLQHADYAVWQRQILHPAGPAHRCLVDWWKEQLCGALPVLRLPFARATAATAVVPDDGKIFWSTERQVSHRLNALGSAGKATRPMVRLAALAALLAAETGQAEIVVGLYVTGRNRLQLQNMIGDFSNLVTLRFRSDITISFREWLAAVAGKVREAEAHSALPYENLREELDRQGVGLPEIKVIFHISRLGRLIEFAGLKLIWMRRLHQRFSWGFTFDFDEQNEENNCSALFDPRIYDPEGVRRFALRYTRLLEVASRHPDKTLDDLLALSLSDAVSSPETVPAMGH
jgi:amino acid adenylation domain-containing protein